MLLFCYRIYAALLDFTHSSLYTSSEKEVSTGGGQKSLGASKDPYLV